MTSDRTVIAGRALLMAGAAVGLALVSFLGSPDGTPVRDSTAAPLKSAISRYKAGDWHAAMPILERFASAAEPSAWFYLARAYMAGHGVSRDWNRAQALLLRAVRSDFDKRGAAAYELGRIFQQAKTPECHQLAFQWFLKAADWGFPKAHMQLAKHLERGIGVARDPAVAAMHYRKAVASGIDSAALRLARLSSAGDLGVDPDESTDAVASLKAKAEAGSGIAAKHLGRAYRDGLFGPPDLAEAKKWLAMSAARNDVGGMRDYALLLLSGKAGQTAAEEALAMLRRAASLGHAGAMTSLGRLHLAEMHGLSRPPAIDWLEQAVALGHAGAMEELGRLKAEGVLIPRDHDGAIDLARRGASIGHRGSANLLKKLTQDQAALSAALDE